MGFNMTTEEAEKAIAFKDAVYKLYENEEFKMVFIEGYFRDEAARLAQASTNYEMQDEVDQRNIHEQIKGIGHLQNFLRVAVASGARIEEAMKEEEEARQEAIKDEETTKIVDPVTGDEFEVEEN